MTNLFLLETDVLVEFCSLHFLLLPEFRLLLTLSEIHDNSVLEKDSKYEEKTDDEIPICQLDVRYLDMKNKICEELRLYLWETSKGPF